MDYKKRMADTLLEENLDAFGAVLIEGPKWCGKTTTAQRQAKSEIWIQLGLLLTGAMMWDSTF